MPERSLLISNPTHTSEVSSGSSEVNPEPVAWEITQDFQGIMNYNPRHDIQDFLDLKNLNCKIPPEKYTQLLNQTVSRTKRQLEKALGERFGVEKSTVEYFIEDGKLKSPDYPEPVVERYKRGQQFLAENGSTETQRETAEVEGIEKVQELLTNLANTSEVGFDSSEVETAKKTKIIIISPVGPEGSLYHDNIFYVWEQKGDLIEMTRFHSTLDYQGFLQAARTVDPNYQIPHEQITAAHFLDNPAQTDKKLEEILEIFSQDQDTQPYTESLKVIEECTPLILSYINTLVKNPLNINEVKSQVNKIFSASDIATYKIQRSKQNVPTATYQKELNRYFEEINLAGFNFGQQGSYGLIPPRPVDRGCPGGQKGFSVDQPSFLQGLSYAINATSVVDFAPFRLNRNNEDKSDFQCPGRKKDGSKCTYIVRYGSGTRKCPECGAEATCG